ncbi:Gamma-aminobutyric acid receptor subunit beta [Folsomia candida]|uniref:Gamma-aminobutyric acid receptor subunit beta n=1 Tax=Folsomia candida TaxID=158441 RepID=A0A226DH44_FOLCA|nr:Gamma-aminobutyric acid receptor subunit beta [Folsomia candida]
MEAQTMFSPDNFLAMLVWKSKSLETTFGSPLAQMRKIQHVMGATSSQKRLLFQTNKVKKLFGLNMVCASIVSPIFIIDAFKMSDIRYSWAKGVDSVGVAEDVPLPQFKIVGHRQRSFEISLSSGNYSRLALEIKFERWLRYYIYPVYCPATLIVLISFVSFWINRNATTARVALGITTDFLEEADPSPASVYSKDAIYVGFGNIVKPILTMTTLMSSVNAALPKVSYIKSLDVFLGTCFVITLAALLEFVTVGYVGKQIEKRKEEDDAEGGNANETNAKKVGKWGGVAPADLDSCYRLVLKFPSCTTSVDSVLASAGVDKVAKWNKIICLYGTDGKRLMGAEICHHFVNEISLLNPYFYT